MGCPARTQTAKQCCSVRHPHLYLQVNLITADFPVVSFGSSHSSCAAHGPGIGSTGSGKPKALKTSYVHALIWRAKTSVYIFQVNVTMRMESSRVKHF